MKRIFIAICLLAALGGVAQKNNKVNKLMIIGLIGDADTRRLLEEELVFELRDEGIDAIASNRMLNSDLSKEKIAEKCKEHGADGVLFMSVAKKRDPKEYENTGKSPNIVVYTWGPYLYQQGPWTAGANTKVILKSDVIRVSDAKLLTSKNKKLFVGLRIEDSVGQYAKSVVKTVKKVTNQTL